MRKGLSPLASLLLPLASWLLTILHIVYVHVRARALPWSEAHPRVDGDESKHGWTTKQAWMEHRASMDGTEIMCEARTVKNET